MGQEKPTTSTQLAHQKPKSVTLLGGYINNQQSKIFCLIFNLVQVIKSTRAIRKFKNVINCNHMKAIWDYFYPQQSSTIDWVNYPGFNQQFKQIIDFPKSSFSKLQRCQQVDMYLKVLMIIFRYKIGKPTCSGSIIKYMSQINNHYLDGLHAVCLYFYARQKQKTGQFSQSRNQLLFQYSRACVRKDQTSQAVLLTLLLRNYICAKDYQAAFHLIDKSEFPQNISNAQYCRYLYYDGIISAIRGDYMKAKFSLTQSYRKAPQNKAKGFKIACLKTQIAVQLLLGQIPARQIFSNPIFSSQLYPYYKLVQTVLRGRVKQFQIQVNQQKDTFQKDGLFLLIKRMNAVVIKVALNKINQSYSRISFVDIQQKLGIMAGDVQMVVAKAIRDKVINGTIDAEKKYLKINQILDQYSTQAPQKAFQRRIDFCMNIYHTSQRAIIHTTDTPQQPQEDLQEDNQSMLGLIQFQDEI